MAVKKPKKLKLKYSDDPHKDRGAQMEKMNTFKGAKRAPDNLGFKSGKPRTMHEPMRSY